MTYFIYLILFLFPMLLSVLFNFIIDKGNFNIIRNDLKYILKVLFEIVKILVVINLVAIILYAVPDQKIDIKRMVLNVSYFSIFFSLIIFINYFSTKYLKFKICIKVFLDELLKFFQDNFILNLLFFTLLVFVRKNNDLIIGLIGSYFFFSLTTIHNEYKKNINGNNKDLRFLYKIVQLLLNLCILMSFVSIEKIMLQYSQNQLITIGFYDILFSFILEIAITINYFLPQIEHFCLKLICYKK